MRIIINNIAGPLVLTVLSLFLVACGSAPVAPSVSDVAQPDKAAAPERRAARIGLALGGGAARGFAHVGVIQVLEEAGLHPQLVTGTSAGSLVAALYASGKTSQELRRVAETMEEKARRLIGEFLEKRGTGLEELRARSKGVALKIELAGELRKHTAMSMAWIANELHAGAPNSVWNALAKHRKTENM